MSLLWLVETIVEARTIAISRQKYYPSVGTVTLLQMQVSQTYSDRES